MRWTEMRHLDLAAELVPVVGNAVGRLSSVIWHI